MSARPLNLFDIPLGVPFARTLAEGAVARAGDDPLTLAGMLVLVPTRRAARTLREAFAEVRGGAALGPNIRALGDIGEDDIVFNPAADDLTLPPAIAPLRRKLLLAALVRRWAEARGGALPIAQAVSHAGELGRLLDEVTTQSADLAKLKGLVTDAALAAHWNDVVKFLDIIAEAWPRQLDAEGMIEPAQHRDMLLRAIAARLDAAPPDAPVIAAGSTGSIPATAELLRVVATLPNGAVVLPGLDTKMDAESWKALDAAHAQYGLRELLVRLGAERADVRPWPHLPPDGAHRAARARFLSEALRPPPTTDAWRALLANDGHALKPAFDGLTLIEAATPREEALTIAVALREALEAPGRTAALVTPDRALARRVAAELSRWDIVIDDSAGTPLARTPAGAFLALLARAAAEDFAPVPLLALLKHPLARGKDQPHWFRRNARTLERIALRGLRPEPGLAGIGKRLSERLARMKGDWSSLTEWYADLTARLSPLADATAKASVPLADIATAHAQAAEALAGGAAKLWCNEDGEAAAQLISGLVAQSAGITLAQGREYGELFRDLAETVPVRPPYGRHPRLAILGTQEARLLHFDLVVLGGLNEGTWPGETANDPFLSRPMRERLGLEAPERRIGLAAHDFVSLAALPRVVMTRALKKDGAPTVASRWIQRIEQLAAGLGRHDSLTKTDLRVWASGLDWAERVARVRRPDPRPPVEVRPSKIGITDVEKWLRDPYFIYAKYVLRLKPLDPLDQEPGPRERGIAIHEALEQFLKEFPSDLPADALARLIAIGNAALTEAGAGPAAMALWRPRLARAARWFLEFERERRAGLARSATETSGTLAIPRARGTFTVTGRADRIDIFTDGSAAIVDYKTGRVPSPKQIDTLMAPQLPLEAAMLHQGGFPGIAPASVRELVHVQIRGGDPAGKTFTFDDNADGKAREALDRMTRRVAWFDDEATPYRSWEARERVTDVGDYDHLARVNEWSVIEDDEGGAE